MRFIQYEVVVNFELNTSMFKHVLLVGRDESNG